MKQIEEMLLLKHLPNNFTIIHFFLEKYKLVEGTVPRPSAIMACMTL